MRHSTPVAVALTVAILWPGVSAAGPMLTGSVTYDPLSHLYTYTYTLDDRSAPAAVDTILIRVATHVYDLNHLAPVSITGPAPFDHPNLYSGGTWDESAFASGTLYGWEDLWGPPLTRGVRTGLSFTSRYGPGAGDTPNYELYSTAATRPPLNLSSGFVEYGRVVAPDLTHVPEPATLVIAGIGLAAIGWRGLRRRKDNGRR